VREDGTEATKVFEYISHGPVLYYQYGEFYTFTFTEGSPENLAAGVLDFEGRAGRWLWRVETREDINSEWQCIYSEEVKVLAE
jgi:hypothetical protein